MTQDAIDIHGYLDYRAFLRDYYNDRKARGRGFSYRAFSRRAGLKSPNYLKLVIDGQRNLSEPMAERFAEACGLVDEAARYFCDLVRFNQANTAEERHRAYSAMIGHRRYQQAHQLDMAHAAYFGAWYMPAVRELAASPHFRPDPRWIAQQLVPAVSEGEARRALEVLQELGLLVDDGEGGLSQADALLSTGPETRGVHIASYHRTMSERAMAAIDLVPAAERDISSLTLAVSEEGLARFKERLQRFRRELLELSALEKEPSQVIQIGFQLFPLTRKTKEDEAP